MEYSSIASVWANRFHIFDKTILRIEEMECILSYIDTCSHYLYNKYPNEIFNLVTYDTYYGNFGHGICYKIQRMIENGFILECHPYLYVLMLVRYNYNLNLMKMDYYEETALENLQNNNALKNTQLNILKKLLDPSYCIISRAQSFVRRWLACRKVQKMKFRNILDHILTAPSQQVEHNVFPNFPGGQDFLKATERFHTASITGLVNLLI